MDMMWQNKKWNFFSHTQKVRNICHLSIYCLHRDALHIVLQLAFKS